MALLPVVRRIGGVEQAVRGRIVDILGRRAKGVA